MNPDVRKTSERSDRELFERLVVEETSGRPVVLATIVGCQGSVPRSRGARMLIWADGSAFGSVGGGCVEARIRSAARDVLLVTRQPRLVQVHLTDEGSGGTGDVCGGQMEVFLDYLNGEGVHGGA